MIYYNYHYHDRVGRKSPHGKLKRFFDKQKELTQESLWLDNLLEIILMLLFELYWKDYHVML